MPYTITNPNEYLKLHVSTTLQNYNNLYLQLFTNNSNTPHNPNYVGTYNDGVLTFTVPHSDFAVGDVITKAKLVLSGSTNLYDLSDGVTILVDGEETEVFSSLDGSDVELDENDEPIVINPVKQPYFAVLFADDKEHDVQAIFKGNKHIGVSVSDKYTVVPQQIAEEETTLEGTYKLTPTKFKSSMAYMESVNWEFLLTKGGTPVPSKSVEVDLPSGTVVSNDTDTNGIRYLTRDAKELSNNPTHLNDFRNWAVGTHKVQARFYHYDEGETTKQAICKTELLTLKITKGTPLMSFAGAGKKGKKAQFKLKDPQGFNLTNKKVTITVGGKTYNKTTNSNGNAWLTINSKGYKTYKVKYAGDKNLKSKTWTFTETVM